MKLVYISNFLNHHIEYLCQEFYALLGKDFAFIETKANSQDSNMFRMGYAYYLANDNTTYPWIRKSYYSSDTFEECTRLAFDSDVVIIGSAEDKWIIPRLKSGKLTFHAHERWYRNRPPVWKYPKAYIGGWIHHRRWKSLYMLCASAFTAWDAWSIGCYKNKTYKWGYFPKMNTYSLERIKESKRNNVPQLLWSGRIVDWKHLEDAIIACDYLNQDGFTFMLTIIGDGPEMDHVRQMVLEKKLQDKICFCGSVKPDQVRQYMEKSNIYLFTSNRKEGWGVVLNEAMNSGCSVVASHEAGSVPYLLKDNVNGLIYESGNIQQLYEKVKYLIQNPEIQMEFGIKAYETIVNEWSPEIAAKRFLELSKQLIENKANPSAFVSGPCSIAQIIHDDWIQGGN